MTDKPSITELLSKASILVRGLRDPEMPVHIKVIVCLLLAYVISPIDLIPDFIPVLGLLDELVLIPLVVTACWKMVPEHVLEKHSLDPVKAWPRWLIITGTGVVLTIWTIFIILVVMFSA